MLKELQMFSTITIRTAYSRHILRAHFGGFAPLAFIAFVRTVANAATL